MASETHIYDTIVIGAGVAGICQIKHLADNGFDALLLEAHADLGGTWFRNRYPGCRFDSESYTYGYRFSQEVLDEWHWKEHFSSQPENLKYLNFVADKFDLRQYMRFNSKVESMVWNEEARLWTVTLTTGETFVTRYVISCLGALSIPTLPRVDGIEDFKGQWFHTYDWPDEGLDLSRKRVGIIGTGATGIQIISEIADKVDSLTVFQRHANWSIPLNNAPISETEMDDIRARYDEIFAACDQTHGGFTHLPDRRGYENVSEDERLAFWDELYDRTGFALLVGNFPETNFEEGPNRDLTNYVEARIRARIDDPAVADKLIPKNHSFGMKRLPLETNYFETYNRNNVQLIDLLETPIERVTETGIKTTTQTHELDLIIYATGFDAITGALNRIDIRGCDNQSLRDKWHSETTTYLGLLSHNFPNFLMVGGPQSVSGSTNYPPAIEMGVNWVTKLLIHARDTGKTRIEAPKEAEDNWTREVIKMQDRMPFAQVKSWFTGYNPNAKNEGTSDFRYNAYWGGAPRYKATLQKVCDEGFPHIEMA
ncbi:MAG: flavin-containing monooxygenase [Hyphomonas sp.]